MVKNFLSYEEKLKDSSRKAGELRRAIIFFSTSPSSFCSPSAIHSPMKFFSFCLILLFALPFYVFGCVPFSLQPGVIDFPEDGNTGLNTIYSLSNINSSSSPAQYNIWSYMQGGVSVCGAFNTTGRPMVPGVEYGPATLQPGLTFGDEFTGEFTFSFSFIWIQSVSSDDSLQIKKQSVADPAGWYDNSLTISFMPDGTASLDFLYKYMNYLEPGDTLVCAGNVVTFKWLGTPGIPGQTYIRTIAYSQTAKTAVQLFDDAGTELWSFDSNTASLSRAFYFPTAGGIQVFPSPTMCAGFSAAVWNQTGGSFWFGAKPNTLLDSSSPTVMWTITKGQYTCPVITTQPATTVPPPTTTQPATTAPPPPPPPTTQTATVTITTAPISTVPQITPTPIATTAPPTTPSISSTYIVPTLTDVSGFCGTDVRLVGLEWKCVDGVWQANISQTISTTEWVQLDVPVLLTGDLQMENKTRMVLLYAGEPMLNISGNAQLAGTLWIDLRNAPKGSDNSRLVIGYVGGKVNGSVTDVRLLSDDMCLNPEGQIETKDYHGQQMLIVVTNRADGCKKKTISRILPLVFTGIAVIVLVMSGYFLHKHRVPRWLWRSQEPEPGLSFTKFEDKGD